MATPVTAIELHADIRGLQTEMQRGVTIVNQGFDQLNRAADRTTNVFRTLAAALPVALFAAKTREIVNLGDRYEDLATGIGASVEQISFLDFAATQSGASLEQLSTSVSQLQKNLSIVAKGGTGEASDALRALRLDAQELTQSDLIGQLSKVGDALRGLENPTERAAVAQGLFGESAKQLLPLLISGERGIAQLAGRFVELNGAITTEQAALFSDVNDSIGELSLSARQLGVALANATSPALIELFEVLTDGANNAAPFFEFFTNRVRKGLLQLAQDAKIAELKIAEFLESTVAKLPGVELRVDPAEVREAIRDLQLQLGDLDRELEDRGAARVAKRLKLREALGANLGVATGIDGSGSSAEEKAAAARAKREAEAIRQLNLRLVAEEDATEAARVRFEIESGAYQEFSKESKDRIRALAEELDGQRALGEEQKRLTEAHEKQRESVKAAIQELAQERESAIAALRTPQESYVAEVNRLLSLGLDDTNLQRGIESARNAMLDAQEAARQTSDVARDLGLTFESAFEDAIVGGRAFSEVLQGIADDIQRLAVREFITKPVLGGLQSVFGGDGEGFAGFFSGLFGNARGGLYKVGGSGSEHPVAFTAKAGEYVAVGTRMAGESGGGVVVNVVNNAGANVDVGERVVNGQRQIDVLVEGSIGRLSGAGRFNRIGLTPPRVSR